MTDSDESVGAQLMAAREARGLTVDDVCRRTNIRPAVVSALESDDIGPSGGVVYARGHVRSLAHALDLDAAPLLAAFDAAHDAGFSPPILVSDTNAAEVSLRPSRPPVTGPKWPLVMAGVLVIVIVIALVQLLRPDSKDGAKAAPSAVPTAPKHTGVPPAKPTPTPPSLVFPVPPEGVTLRIVLTSKPSWLDVTDERGVSLMEKLARPSPQPIDLHAAGMLRATIGDASAAAVSCNGRPFPPLGGPGAVVYLVLTRGSPQCPGG